MNMMGSQMLDIIRQGVWASLTGGWYYDPYHRIFTNTFHLYVWLFLFCLPFSFHLYFPSTVWYVWVIYAVIVGIFFTIIKVANHVLHHLFDTGEVFEEPVGSDEDYGSRRTAKHLISDVNQESIGMQDLGGARSTTPPVSCSSRNSLSDPSATTATGQGDDIQERPPRRGRRLERPSSTFDLKVDVHISKQGAALSTESEQTCVDISSCNDAPAIINMPEDILPLEGCNDTDVVIMVDESPGQRPHHEATREMVLEESKSGERSDGLYRNRDLAPENHAVSQGEVSQLSHRSQGEVSFSSMTTSSQLTVSGGNRRSDTARRFSNLSNLARSLPSGSSAMMEPITGSLDLAAILDPSYTDTVRRRTNRTTTHVRRTKSALETGLGNIGNGQSVSSHPVSLDGGINADGTKYRIKGAGGRSLDMTSNQAITEIAEEVSSKEGELDVEAQADQSFQQHFKGSDVDLSTYQEQLEEATKALLIAGKYLEKDFKNQKYLANASNEQEEYSEIDSKGSGVYLPMIGVSRDWDETDSSEPIGERKLTFEKETQASSVNKSIHSHNDTGQSLLSTVGLDWLFSDSEPDQPPGSPKPVGHTYEKSLRSRSESPRSSSAAVTTGEESREPRDSSHGSSGTDTETRALLNKLESVENALEQSGGAIPKRRPNSRRLRNVGHRSGSLDGGRCKRDDGDKMRAVRRRPTLEVGEDYQMPSTNTLYDDAAGLKLFLDILNGPDGQNKEAEAELRKLIDRRRNRMEEDGSSSRRKHMDDEVSDILGGRVDEDDKDSKSRKRRLARRRRHNAQSQNDQLAESGFAIPEMVLDERKIEGETARKREKKSRRTRDDVPKVDEEVPHIAANHEDTTTGAVHCFKDEYGNWQTYTFGGETLASTTVGAPANASRALATMLNRQQSSSSGGSARDQRPPPPDPPSSTPWSHPLLETLETPPSSRSSMSADSGLTVILDSPAMVFQPNGERTRSVESSSVNQRDSYWSRESSTANARESYWSRENSVLGTTNQRLQPYSGGSNSSGPGFRRYNNPLHMFAESFLERTRQAASNASIATNGELTFSSTFGGGSAQLTRIDESSLTGQLNLSSGVAGQLNLGSGVSSQLHIGNLSAAPRIRKYHKLSFPFMKSGIKVWLDRLQLLNILDQDHGIGVTISCIFLSIVVSVLGAMVLQQGYYRDLWLILFCIVLASCQYSLLKSVQPDASSPTHGFNPTTVFSRPIYFSICSSLVLILEAGIQSNSPGFKLYGNRMWMNNKDLKICLDLVYGFILAFPIIFTLGLMPQINTALMYLLEQIDIQIFGGNAASSLQASAYCVARSIISVIVIFGFAYGGLTESSHSAHAQEVLFSIFCSLSVALSYHLSRCSGDPTVVLSVMKRHFMAILSEDTVETPTSTDTAGVQSPTDDPASPQDPLPKKLRGTVNARLKNDAIICLLAAIVVFLVHQSDIFIQAFPTLDLVLWIIAVLTGFLLHYLLPHLRKQTPWKCFAAPLLASHEQGQFEVRAAAKVMWWEKCLLWASSIERSILYPLIFLSAVTHDRPVFESLFGVWGGSLVMTITLIKCLRSVWSDSTKQYFTLLLCILLFQYNPDGYLNNLVPSKPRTSPFLLDYFLTTILTLKLTELYLKCQFVITYIAPHQINWGSAFHAFAQPFSVPHSAMLFLQAVISSILSTPLNPLLGSTIFICSYVRPVKFWERNYNTKRTDHSNTRLASQFEVRNPGADDNNLNSIFYEHLTRSLQHSLAGDLMLGRWGAVQQGDCFVLASDYLNCLVHIIEMGNGLCTFQVRGLEFRGTYCQQREVEAISEGVEEDEACCCCEPGHLPHMLSVNAAFSQRWLAWEVSAVKYVLEGYSISDNSAQSMLQVWDLRKVLISYYIKSIIYYTVRSPKLAEWLANQNIAEAIKTTCDKNFVDLDPIFNSNIDEDFDFRSSGITRNSFCGVYLPWIQHCAQARDRAMPNGKDSEVVSLCFSLSLLGRRALGAASNNSLTSVEFFLIGLHALFKGDFRITCGRDEWVFSDMELLRKVVAPAVRMSLKLHQDHFMSPDEYEESSVLYDAISSHEQNLVISHEGDPLWRNAVLSGAPSLLALRHVVDDGTDEYKIIMLNKRHLSFRVIKLNRECVRGLWAGQQQELIFLRNRNPERGSIQNAKQALRNLINSSCDQPIGYPIYVSPLTTSYSDTNSQVTGVVGGPLSLKQMKLSLLDCWIKLKDRCVEACSSSSSADCENCGGDTGNIADPARSGSLQGNRCSVVSSVSKPSSGTLVSLAGLLNSGSLPSHSSTAPAVSSLELQHIQHIQQARRARTVSGDSSATPSMARLGGIHGRRVAIGRILDPLQVYDNMNLGRRIDPLWPDPDWRAKGGRNAWNSWIPIENMEGPIVHRWTPCHRDPLNRSHTDKTILLLRLGERYVPIAEQAVLILPEDDRVSHKSFSDNEKGSKTGSKANREKEERGSKSTNERGEKVKRSISDKDERETKSSSDKEDRGSRSTTEKNEKENRSTSEKEELWSKSLQSVDSMKSLAGIPSISEREEIVGRDAAEVVELRASTLE